MKKALTVSHFRFGLFICLGFVCWSVSANNIQIKSSVSPEFPEGLHAKYLTYIAEQAGLELDIVPMPFARRLLSLKNGTINLMVGLKHSHKEEGFEFLHPSYEQLRAAYFVPFSSSYLSSPETPLDRLVAGFSIDEKAMLQWARENFADIVLVTNLEQKIRLLERGRIDTFVHFESSATYKIRELGLEKEIVLAKYQPGALLAYHVAINRESGLYSLKSKLEQIILDSIESGAFARIRLAHESALTD